MLKRQDLPSHGKTYRNANHVLLDERSQSEKAMYCIIPTIRKGKNYKDTKKACLARERGE